MSVQGRSMFGSAAHADVTISVISPTATRAEIIGRASSRHGVMNEIEGQAAGPGQPRPRSGRSRSVNEDSLDKARRSERRLSEGESTPCTSSNSGERRLLEQQATAQAFAAEEQQWLQEGPWAHRPPGPGREESSGRAAHGRDWTGRHGGSPCQEGSCGVQQQPRRSATSPSGAAAVRHQARPMFTIYHRRTRSIIVMISQGGALRTRTLPKVAMLIMLTVMMTSLQGWLPHGERGRQNSRLRQPHGER